MLKKQIYDEECKVSADYRKLSVAIAAKVEQVDSKITALKEKKEIKNKSYIEHLKQEQDISIKSITRKKDHIEGMIAKITSQKDSRIDSITKEADNAITKITSQRDARIDSITREAEIALSLLQTKLSNLENDEENKLKYYSEKNEKLMNEELSEPTIPSPAIVCRLQADIDERVGRISALKAMLAVVEKAEREEAFEEAHREEEARLAKRRQEARREQAEQAEQRRREEDQRQSEFTGMTSRERAKMGLDKPEQTEQTTNLENQKINDAFWNAVDNQSDNQSDDNHSDDNQSDDNQSDKTAEIKNCSAPIPMSQLSSLGKEGTVYALKLKMNTMKELPNYNKYEQARQAYNEYKKITPKTDPKREQTLVKLEKKVMALNHSMSKEVR